MIERIRQLPRAERLLLLRLVASVAWVDGVIQDQERRFIHRLMNAIELNQDEKNDVESWLLMPPDPVAADAVPVEHRRLFVEAARAVVFIDGVIAPEEQAHFDALRASLLG